MTLRIHETDSLVIRVSVTRSGDGSAFNLDGSTLTARAGLGPLDVVGTVTFEASSNMATVSFEADDFLGKTGICSFQLRAVNGGGDQVVAHDQFQVLPTG